MDAFLIFLVTLSVLLVLLSAGLVYQAVGSARDRAKYPAPGRVIDVGGHRLHIYCMGQGTPAVVFDSALGGSCLSWALVQPHVAKFTHACSYDRAGFGWSERSPKPRTTQQIVEELHCLLKNAGIPAPYVLVGHSYGGFTARLFATLYPSEVAGIVLVDAALPQEWLQMTERQKKRLKTGAMLCRRGALLARMGIARLVALLASLGALEAARSMVALVSHGALRKEEKQILAPVNKLPPEIRPVLTTFWTQPKFFEALAGQIECMPHNAAAVAATSGLGGIPLVVVSAPGSNPAWQEQQQALAALSSCGKHVVAAQSGHWIPVDQPELVVEAIREVVERARGYRDKEKAGHGDTGTRGCA